jgi:hypothetical protein
MRRAHLVAGVAVTLAVTIASSAFAGTTKSPLGERAAKGQAVESTATVFEKTRLPSVASIQRGSDVRPFLRPGVPDEVQTTALRRAWATEPEIRDFVGMTEDLP